MQAESCGVCLTRTQTFAWTAFTSEPLPSPRLRRLHRTKQPPLRRCPDLVFTRLRAALGGFAVERTGPGGGVVLAFYHRCFFCRTR